MCRLFGYVASQPASVIDHLGQEGFDVFTSLTAVHSYGWGMAWHGEGDETAHAATSTLSAADDPRYFELAGQPLGERGIVHLRWATGGLAVTEQNTHPFTDGAYAMAHNGNIAPRGRLEELLTPESRDQLRGDTDSERYFRFVMQCIGAADDEPTGVRQAVGALHEEFPDSSLNALLLTPSRLFAVHVNSTAATPMRALNEIFAADDTDVLTGHETEYYEMSYRVTPDAVYVISSGLDEEGWSNMGTDTVVEIDLETRTTARLAAI